MKLEITVVDRARSRSHKVSRDEAEKMVARGRAEWCKSGLKRIILHSVSARGEAREWRKSACIERDDQGRICGITSTMQLVPLDSRIPRNRRGRRERIV